MRDRTPMMLGLIAVMTALAVFINWDLFDRDYIYPSWVVRRLSWHGEEFDQRSLKLRQGLDLQGGLQVLLEADESDSVQLEEGDLEAAANVIKNRVDALGVTEPVVLTQGLDKIVVELPGVKDPELAVRTIGQTAVLEFVNAADRQLFEGDEVFSTSPQLYRELPEEKRNPFLGDPRDPLGEGTGDAESTDDADDSAEADEGDEAAAEADAAAASEDENEEEAAADEEDEPSTTETILPTVITGEFVESASLAYDQLGQPVVSFELTSDGGLRMQQFSRDHVGQIMAITLDGKVISAPVLRDAIGASGQISGDFTPDQARSLAVQIESGSLPVPLKVVGQNLIGPTLGGEAIDAAVRGGIVGFLAVMIFMLFYYRMPGLLADGALTLYALLTLAVFRLVPVTLTLAGIAGFVLSIGMAVDANILIFERMKEELRAGRRIGSAMDIGFDRAWPSIRDSNVSTLITCAILFWFGNQFGASIVKGFAVTLALGVIVSLFTAITATRTFLKVANRVALRDADVSATEDSKLKLLFGF